MSGRIACRTTCIDRTFEPDHSADRPALKAANADADLSLLEVQALTRRRIVVASGAATLAGWAIADMALAQTARAKRLGSLATTPGSQPGYLEDQMRQRGWEIGRELVIIRRFADGDASRLAALAQELVAERVDVILASGDAEAVAAAKATTSIPIVMQGLAPVELGLAKSLARPGGNVTGVVYQAWDYIGKLVELMRALQPGLTRLGLQLRSPSSRLGQIGLQRWLEVAGPMGISVIVLPRPPTLVALDDALAVAERERVQVLNIGLNHALRGEGFQKIRAWAIRNRVVTVSAITFRAAVLAYGTSSEHFDKLWFDLLDRVLRGANPAETPIQQPTHFELAIDRGQLRAMGLTVPQAVLLQATEVID